ncbi:hypothetical protein [Akkermansia sp.]|uniref:hypothetical protein n=3 Tax=Akkermansia sp. TaxID=1872421 RepID=UPI003AAD227C
MQARILGCILACCLVGWVQAAPDAAEVKGKIARKIWQNECSGTVRGLVSWNRGEAFPSLGIGHFIWFPTGVREKFEESFPPFVEFCRRRGARLPEWCYGPAPWKTREEFIRADVRGGLPDRMRQWLSSPAALQMQTDFIINRSLAALDRIRKQSRRPGEMAARYNAVAAAPNGMYALIDYVNFKGEGTNPSEQYRGQGWGSGRFWRKCARLLPASRPRLNLRKRPRGCFNGGWTTVLPGGARVAGWPDGRTAATPTRRVCDGISPFR